MPTYLTPGVYVEEVPSASKPIEGVGTAVAAFVGVAPGGPVDAPMRISNWTQFAKIFGDRQNPDNGPFMEGSYLAHSVYGFFQNGGTLCWVIRVGGEDGGTQAPRAALPAATDKSIEALRVVALEGVSDPVTIEISQDPSTGEPSDEGESKDSDVTYTLIVTAGSEREEYPGVAMKKGRTGIATKVGSSKLIKIEETGAALPETRIAPGRTRSRSPPISTESISAGDFEGDVASRKGMGSLAAIDEVTMVVMPDVMTLAVDGDGTQVRDLQGKMIAHCEIAGDRMAILDAPA